MPIKPWALGPKKSLGIFDELGGVLDARAGREAQKAKAQQSLEDRLIAGQQREAANKSRTIEDALHQAQIDAMNAPKVPKIIGTKEDPTTGDVFNTYDDGHAEPVMTQAPQGDAERMSRSLGLPAQSSQLRMGVKPKDDNTLVRVQQEDGSVVYMPREQAAGQHAPAAAGQGGGAEKAKRVQAFANATDALDALERELTTTGSTLMPGVDQSVLKTAYENTQLQMKELYNLGVLNGPDLALMRRVLNDPTSFTGRALAFGSADEQTKRTLAQLQQVRQVLAKAQSNLAAGNAAKGGGNPSPSAGPQAQPTTTRKPTFEEWKAARGKKTP